MFKASYVNLISGGLAIIANYIFAFFLGPHEYGIYAFIILSFSLSCVFNDIGLTNPIVSSENIYKYPLILIYVISNLISSLVFLISILTIAGYEILLKNKIILLWPFISCLNVFFIIFLQRNMKILNIVIGDFLYSLFSLLGSLFIYFNFFDKNLNTFIYLSTFSLLGKMLIYSYFFISMKGHNKIIYLIRKNNFCVNDFLKESITLSSDRLLRFYGSKVDQFAFSLLLNPSEFGCYQLVSNLISQIPSRIFPPYNRLLIAKSILLNKGKEGFNIFRDFFSKTCSDYYKLMSFPFFGVILCFYFLLSLNYLNSWKGAQEIILPLVMLTLVRMDFEFVNANLISCKMYSLNLIFNIAIVFVSVASIFITFIFFDKKLIIYSSIFSSFLLFFLSFLIRKKMNELEINFLNKSYCKLFFFGLFLNVTNLYLVGIE